MELVFDIPGAGRLLLMGEVAHDMALGSSEVHFFQCGGHSLVGAPVEDADKMTEMDVQNDHLLKM